IENTLADHNGWEEGYKTGDGRAPNKLSHNIYIQYDNLDVTFRDNVILRGSSVGAQIRSGGMVEGNAFLDNNVALNILGGSYRGSAYDGNYSLLLDNVVSSGGHKEAADIGALAWGVENAGHLTGLVGNIIAHLADPADPEERAEKTSASKDPLNNKLAAFVDDTIVYNWVSDYWRGHRLYDTDQNLPDIDPALLDEVTLRRF